MVPAKKWARMRVRSPDLGAPWPAARPRACPRDWAVLAIAALLCLGLRATSTGVPVAPAAWREGGRVLACRYFTGTHVVERQHAVPGSGAGRPACPLVRAGQGAG